MAHPTKKATTIWFTTEDEWRYYKEAKKILKEDKQTVSSWVHQELRKLVRGRQSKS